MRALNMRLFLISLSQEDYQKRRPILMKEGIHYMEELYSALNSMVEKSFLRRWEFGRPYVSWEIVSFGGKVDFYFLAPTFYSRIVSSAVEKIHGYFLTQRVKDYNIFFEKGGSYETCQVKTKKGSLLPIKTYKSMENDPFEDLMRILTSLSGDDRAVVQIITRPTTVTVKKGERVGKEEKAKLEKNNFDTNIRITAASREHQNAKKIIVELRKYFDRFSSAESNSFSNNCGETKKSLFQFVFRIFNEDEKSVLSTEELASVFHLTI